MLKIAVVKCSKALCLIVHILNKIGDIFYTLFKQLSASVEELSNGLMWSRTNTIHLGIFPLHVEHSGFKVGNLATLKN